MAVLIEENEASAEVTTVYADIKATRGVDWINNFWKAIANHPATLKRMWGNVKQVMAPGALDVLRSDMESLLTTDFRRVDVVRRIESRVATIDRTPREWDRARMPK